MKLASLIGNLLQMLLEELCEVHGYPLAIHTQLPGHALAIVFT